MTAAIERKAKEERPARYWFPAKEKGSLSKAKLAEVAVLSMDILKISPEDLPSTRSVLALVDGKMIYDSHVLRR
jgi:predicted amidohydrolase YtcJ